MDSTHVSIFKNLSDKRPSKIKLSLWLKGSTILNRIVDRVRSEPDKHKALKQRLPCITPSGIFTGLLDSDLVNHSGLISIDIDHTPPDKAKGILSGIDYILYAGLSASGRGVWALIRIKHPDQHRAYFRAISEQLKSKGLDIDQTGINVGRKRFYSYDNEPYISPLAVTFNQVYEIQDKKTDMPDTVFCTANHECDKVQMILHKCELMGADITAIYKDWITIAGVLVTKYGEAGRNLYHRFSRNYHKYSAKETDSQYDKCLRNKRDFHVGALFNIGRKYNIVLKL